MVDDYRAAKMGNRFRLFYKVYQQHSIVYFAWVNGEDHPHTSGDVDDCYKEFVRAYNNSEIDKYAHETLVHEVFKKGSSWGAKLVHVSYERKTTQEEYKAYSTLTLGQIKSNSYKILSVSVSKKDMKLASKLLDNLIQEADRNNLTLSYELILKSAELPKSRYLLNKFGFSCVVQDFDVELWERNPS